jgi:uncharacterized protein YjbJ (UPF0337 family)
MNWNRIEGNWEQWGNLTADDFDQIAGKREQLEGDIQQRYSISKTLATQTPPDPAMVRQLGPLRRLPVRSKQGS